MFASVDRRSSPSTYLESLGQGVVTGKVGLEPPLGRDGVAKGILRRLASAAAAATVMGGREGWFGSDRDHVWVFDRQSVIDRTTRSPP